MSNPISNMHILRQLTGGAELPTPTATQPTPKPGETKYILNQFLKDAIPYIGMGIGPSRSLPMSQGMKFQDLIKAQQLSKQKGLSVTNTPIKDQLKPSNNPTNFDLDTNLNKNPLFLENANDINKITQTEMFENALSKQLLDKTNTSITPFEGPQGFKSLGIGEPVKPKDLFLRETLRDNTIQGGKSQFSGLTLEEVSAFKKVGMTDDWIQNFAKLKSSGVKHFEKD